MTRMIVTDEESSTMVVKHPVINPVSGLVVSLPNKCFIRGLATSLSVSASFAIAYRNRASPPSRPSDVSTQFMAGWMW